VNCVIYTFEQKCSSIILYLKFKSNQLGMFNKLYCKTKANSIFFICSDNFFSCLFLNLHITQISIKNRNESEIQAKDFLPLVENAGM